ncbi:Fic family protein [Lysinibacillus sphaericus]|uniref:Fic family protein n=1 Tax=Lysinibacillus sphaericus TaxID=1421 RepID=UPI003805A886
MKLQLSVIRLEVAATEQEKLVSIAEAHIVFERIHPFADGNGRTGRMILNYSLFGFASLIINSKEKATYLRYLAEQDAIGFSKFIESALTEEQQRLQRFVNKEQQQISPNSLD